MEDEKDKMREDSDEQMVNSAFQHLLDTYLASRHRKKVDIITKAFNFARQAHKGVRRLSGEPYILHPISVAQIACEEVGLGSTSICAALLHDVVEDTDYTTEDIENIFGAKIAQIVDGLTKISGGIFGEQASAQAENFKKLLLTMSDDIRVILIKICDRLHNMRTLESQPTHRLPTVWDSIRSSLNWRTSVSNTSTLTSIRASSPNSPPRKPPAMNSSTSLRHLSRRRSDTWVSNTRSRSVSRPPTLSGVRCRTST